MHVMTWRSVVIHKTMHQIIHMLRILIFFFYTCTLSQGLLEDKVVSPLSRKQNWHMAEPKEPLVFPLNLRKESSQEYRRPQNQKTQ